MTCKKMTQLLALFLLLGGMLLPLSARAAAPQAVRPQVAVRNYRSNEGDLSYGLDFNLVVTLKNDTDVTAQRVQATFSAPELTPRKTGGMIIAGDMPGFATSVISQPMTVTAYLFGKKNITVEMNLLYYDAAGAPYSEKLSLLLPVSESISYYKTPTPTPFSQAQMVITEYKTDVEPLQPGMLFNLDVKVQNLGTAPARRVTMIIGGGTTSGGGGTPSAGGVSGGGGEFTNFAPVGASNVQVLGDLAVGSTLEARQNLVVNVSTAPGAYPMKITFSYADNSGNIVNDEQVITLLVFSLPTLDIGFYQPLGALMAGQPNPLPLQVVNLGKKAAVLGNLRIESDNGLVENGQTLVGALDTGGYFTYDSLITPEQPGPLNLTVTIDYTDDFNQARSITKTLTLEVMEAPAEPTLDPNLPPDPNAGGDGGALPEETFWQKAWRFILGIFGLDSAAPATEQPLPGDTAPQNIPSGPVRGPKG